ncbi:MAG: N-6 DNA methylase [Pyrinomonadaceae bacterium]|nr:N-6 DNA methylase [Pyrinomonadaceae bacterium]
MPAARSFKKHILGDSRQPTNLFSLPGRAEVKIDTRGGTHFTPPALARAVVEQAFWNVRLGESITILDPSCGAGAFLHEVLRYLQRTEYRGRICLLGSDISENAVAIARFVLSQAIRDWPEITLDRLEIQARDSLNEVWPSADLILMNPPFISWGGLTRNQKAQVKEILGRRYVGRPDFSMAFIDKAVSSLRDGGVLGTLLPASVLSTEASLGWRRYILEQAAPVFLAVFGDYGIFRHAIVDVGCAVLRIKKAFEAATLGELIKLRRSNTTPTTPTSIVKDLDPIIERVIDRCIQRDPAERPSSALQVAAALPGGDPIAAALAAGETPSPEMVAAAPKQGILRPAIAGALLASFLVLLALCCWLTKYAAVYRMTSLDKSPEVLRANARDVIRKLGYTEQPLDSADGVILKDDYLNYIAAHDQSPTRWEKMRTEGPGPYRFWYRQSPRYFETFEDMEVDKPALDVSGMASVYLDMEGRLHWFIGVPPQREPPGDDHSAPDWSLPFREAGLDIANFQSVASTSVPLHAYDARAAWDGADPAHPELKTRVEAAAFRGKLIYFETIYPWDQPLRQEQTPESGGDRALTFILIAIFLIALVGSVVLARRNLQLGRGDRRGATRVALIYFTVRMLVWLFVEHHNGLPAREFQLFILHLSTSVFSSSFLWLLYVALEPFVRRRWPGWIISWSRPSLETIVTHSSGAIFCSARSSAPA